MGNLLGSPVTEKDTHLGTTPDGLIYAVSSMQGWRIHMEDAHITETNVHAQRPTRTEDAPLERLPLAGHSIFAVFDGHGGSFAAQYAAANFCRVLARQPKFVAYAKFVQERPQKEASMSGDAAEKAQYVRSGLELLEGALRDAFVDIDRETILAVKGDTVVEANTPYNEPTPPPTTTASPSSGDDSSDPAMGGGSSTGSSTANSAPTPNEDEDSGTTAVVVVVTPQWVICANAGDSRAVFAKQGNQPVPLSYDHKPDDEEETRRIKAAGGYVAGGRVEGDLAVSRGLGDFRFKEEKTVLAGSANFKAGAGDDEDANMLDADDQKVSPVPDIIVQNRNADSDEFIIVACDGIWDVLTNYDASKAVAAMFAEGESDMGLVCEELIDMCLRLGSKDNMTALIIRFPAQQIGEGEGVTGRRAARAAAEKSAAGADGAGVEDEASPQ
uniref:protein-serine/threonine phosphatase n=1 Tax=Grammatophora oceanica TaxID=210454 RepID=A0A6U5HF47_9STRA|eukprot:CAMPEP_0194061168 /NCGR_PEP_ID=MMETSP0009_2-20130614/73857_1 /TAXON_ID=210454 /ORGANISM="Grammatophora oceanica, Strain CCMP 410" /LENGTH=441 /DNA_ID=CAMNT_0038712381 /DNA_START=191 /DNA_END=1516 /DNA_ORIENTATION=-